MYLKEFPDLKWLKSTIANRFGDRRDWRGRPLLHDGWPSVVLNVKASQVYRDNLIGPVSIFSNVSGTSSVVVEGRRVNIPEGYFFITNNGQPYTLEIGQKQSETFNVHFGNHFVSQALQSFKQDFEPDQIHLTQNFRNRLLPINEQSKKLILKIKNDHAAMHEEENLFELFAHLMMQEKDLQRQASQMSSLKKSTRDEIMKRLLASLDFIYSSSEQKLSLDDLAAEACLSKFHFLRLFKSAFNKTPYQFINEIRVERAKGLLKVSELSVREVAQQTGFDSSSSFSRTFYHSVGLYPTQFQRDK